MHRLFKLFPVDKDKGLGFSWREIHILVFRVMNLCDVLAGYSVPQNLG